MNDEWLHKIHDRMADYEADEPDGLWASIEKAREEGAVWHRGSKRLVVLLWSRRLSVAAALLAFVVTLGLYLVNNPSHTGNLSLQAGMAGESGSKSDIANPKEEAPQIVYADNSASNAPGMAARIASASRIVSEGSKRIAETAECVEPGMPLERVTETMDKEESKPQVAVLEKRDSVAKALKERLRDKEKSDGRMFYASIAPRSKGGDRLSVSLYASGGTGSMLNHQSVGNFLNSAAGPDNASWKDNPMLGILAFNQGKAIETDIKHRLPIRTGLSFTYNITDRLGIESGVSYTNLISDIREGSEDHYVAGEQSLHYIGIPVNLKYRFFSWQRLHLYGSAGVLGEKCVSAKIDKSFILNNRTEETKTERISDRPLQWSVNTSVGMQVDIINSIGLYAEPGISYYFKDGTDLQTIYKEKPLNFNLNFGIRFSFGK